MSQNTLPHLVPVPLTRVAIDGPFWAPRLAVNRAVTIPENYAKCQATGRIDAFRLDWRPGSAEEPPHHFWDSDVAKWLEAAAYSLATHPDAETEAQVDAVVDLIAAAQQPDGYLNVHFTVVEPQNRFRNLRDMHELYCAGHLMEAAVAHYQATGKRKLLDVMCRYADYIDTVFGPEPGKKRGYCGHEEIELALVKLYRATGEERYLHLAKFFVDERGRQPHYYDIEARARGEDPTKTFFGGDYAYLQAHVPVREQTDITGHSVRAMYLCSGMADVAMETGDVTLLPALERLWRSATERRMYVTGGIGSSAYLERFTFDYDLPNDIAYAETCAAIALVFFAHRMLQITGDGAYADVMERALYNGVISGVSLAGDTFFYANPLEVDPIAHANRPDLFGKNTILPRREPWFSCSCCPPNLARMLASLGQYVASTGLDPAQRSQVFIHLYMGGRVELELADGGLVLTQETRYPWDGDVRITVQPDAPARFTLALRIPGWATASRSRVNGREVDLKGITQKGYAHIDRVWRPGDAVDLSLPMPVERIEAHPAVRADSGRVALQRGPLVYCLEEADSGPRLGDIALPMDATLRAEFDPSLLGGVVAISAEAQRRALEGWDGLLYQPRPTQTERVTIKAVPYFAWANRVPGEMLVWIRSVS